MAPASEFLTSLALVLLVAAVTTIVFQRLRQPVVFGLNTVDTLAAQRGPSPSLPRSFATACSTGCRPRRRRAGRRGPRRDRASRAGGRSFARSPVSPPRFASAGPADREHLAPALAGAASGVEAGHGPWARGNEAQSGFGNGRGAGSRGTGDERSSWAYSHAIESRTNGSRRATSRRGTARGPGWERRQGRA